MRWPKLTTSFPTLLRFLLLTSALAEAEAELFDGFLAAPSPTGRTDAGWPGGQGLKLAEASLPSQLTITRDGDEIIVAWPSPATGWVLEQSLDLEPSAGWTSVASSLFEAGLTNVSFTVWPPAGTMFYRLRKLRPIDLVPGLTGSWALDDGQGGTAADSSGSNLRALQTNAVWMPGRIGAASLWFNGGSTDAGGGLAWGSHSKFSLLPPSGQPFSMSLWFNADTLTNGWSGLIGNDGNGSNGWHLALASNSAGT